MTFEMPRTGAPERSRSSCLPTPPHLGSTRRRNSSGGGFTKPAVTSRRSVREGGLEPPRPCGHWHLKPARLPFRHSRAGTSVLHGPRSDQTAMAGRSPTAAPARPSGTRRASPEREPARPEAVRGPNRYARPWPPRPPATSPRWVGWRWRPPGGHRLLDGLRGLLDSRHDPQPGPLPRLELDPLLRREVPVRRMRGLRRDVPGGQLHAHTDQGRHPGPPLHLRVCVAPLR